MLASLLAALMVTALPGFAAELPPQVKPFRIEASEKPVADFVRELAASQGMTAVVDPKVGGALSGRFIIEGREPRSLAVLLDAVCAANGLTWYFDGAFLFVDLAADARSEVLRIAPRSAPLVRDTLARLKIADARFPLTVDESGGNVRVSGPRRHVEMVRQAVRLVDEHAAGTDMAEVRLFPLKYAWAADVKLTRSGKPVTIPGVASVLQNLFASNGAPGGAAMARSAGSPLQVGPDRLIKLGTGDTVNAPKVTLQTATPDDGDTPAAPRPGGALPQFQAESRLNAVLVRDTAERMERYERLIASMDVRPRLLEIEVTIMDIRTDTLDSLGVDWRLHLPHADLQIGRGNRPALTFDRANTEGGQVAGVDARGNPVAPLGMLFTASIGHDVRQFLLARVSALAEAGSANFVARPKVLTLDNTEAVLENLTEFHVRVGGYQDAGLFSVTAGTAVRVTPLVVSEKEGRAVMMSVDIQDGDLGTESVDQIPIVRRRTVNTQALVDEGASLLIAGYSTEEKSNATSGVPVLSGLPVVGRLFGHRQNQGHRMERFYLLTPRLVSPAEANPSPAEPAK